MRTILYPTDFSDNSLQAYPYALDIAYLFDAKLILFNSYTIPYSKSNVLVSFQEKLKKEAERELESLKKDALSKEKYKKLEVEIYAWQGEFVSSISKAASKLSADCIVMGTKGASGIKEMFIGSNTLEVIHIADCPVLVIPEKADNAKVDQIAMATDLKPLKSKEQLDPLFQMAKICRASIEFVHVMSPEDQADVEEKVKQAILIDEMAGEIKTSFHFTTNTDIIDGLSEYINKRGPGMIGMLSRKHNLFTRIFTKSITNKLSFRTEIPLLVMDE